MTSTGWAEESGTLRFVWGNSMPKASIKNMAINPSTIDRHAARWTRGLRDHRAMQVPVAAKTLTSKANQPTTRTPDSPSKRNSTKTSTWFCKADLCSIRPTPSALKHNRTWV